MAGETKRLARLTTHACLAAAALLALAGLVAPPAQAAATSEVSQVLTADSLIGTWSAEVTTTVPSSGTVTYVFRPDGTMAIVAGSATVEGNWQAHQGNKFSFVIDTPLRMANGHVVGQRHAVQDGDLHGPNNFTSCGTTVDRDLDGNVIRTFEVFVTATRVST